MSVGVLFIINSKGGGGTTDTDFTLMKFQMKIKRNILYPYIVGALPLNGGLGDYRKHICTFLGMNCISLCCRLPNAQFFRYFFQ